MSPDRERIASALEVTHGNITRAALALSVTAGWLHARLKEYGLSVCARELRIAHAGRSMGKPAPAGPSDDAIRTAWTTHGGCVRAVARALDMPRSTVRYAVKRLGLPQGGIGGIMSVEVGKVGECVPILRPGCEAGLPDRPVGAPTMPPGSARIPSR